jgi:hypothetical protein
MVDFVSIKSIFIIDSRVLLYDTNDLSTPFILEILGCPKANISKPLDDYFLILDSWGQLCHLAKFRGRKQLLRPKEDAQA